MIQDHSSQSNINEIVTTHAHYGEDFLPHKVP